jgi:hypothetical protein
MTTVTNLHAWWKTRTHAKQRKNYPNQHEHYEMVAFEDSWAVVMRASPTIYFLVGDDRALVERTRDLMNLSYDMGFNDCWKVHS